MASYNEARKTGKFLGAYVCSHCRSVILRDYEFYAVGYSRWTQKKANEAAEAAAAQGTAALASFTEKPFLVTCPKEDRSYNLVSGFGTNGLERGCPYCGHRETWQLDAETAGNLPQDPETGLVPVQGVPMMSCLKTLFTPEKAEELHTAMVAMVTDQARSFWEAHPEEAASVRARLQEIKDQLETLTAQKESIRSGSRYLAALVQQKETQMKGLSMFSAERKTLKAELKELEKQYDAQKAADIQQETLLGKQLQELQKQRKDILIKNPGILGEYEQITPKDTMSVAAIRFN